MSNIDFEKDQQEVIKKTDNIQSLADQVERLESMHQQLEIQEEALKEKKYYSISINLYEKGEIND